jgi:hypothetical protein
MVVLMDSRMGCDTKGPRVKFPYELHEEFPDEDEIFLANHSFFVKMKRVD